MTKTKEEWEDSLYYETHEQELEEKERLDIIEKTSKLQGDMMSFVNKRINQ